MRLVPYWRRWYRMASNVCKLISGGILTTWQAMPEAWTQKLDSKLVVGISVAFLVLGIAGSVVEQPKLRPKE